MTKKITVAMLLLLTMVIGILIGPATLAAEYQSPSSESSDTNLNDTLNGEINTNTPRVQENPVVDNVNKIKTYSDPIDIEVKDIIGGRLSALRDNHGYDESWTYIYNGPIHVTVKNCEGQAFSLISTDQWDKYIFNGPITITIEDSDFDTVSGLRWLYGGYVGNGAEKYNTTEVNNTFTINVKSGHIGTLAGGLYKTAIYGFPSVPKDEMKASIEQGININVSNNAQIDRLVGGHYLTQTEADPAKNVDFHLNGNVNITVDDSKVGTILSSMSRAFLKNSIAVNGNFNVSLLNNATSDQIVSSSPVFTQSFAGEVTGQSSLKIDSPLNMKELKGFNQLNLGGTLHISDIFTTPVDGMNTDIKNPQNWGADDILISYAYGANAKLDETAVVKAWPNNNYLLKYRDLTDTQTQEWYLGTDKPKQATVSFETNGGTEVPQAIVNIGESITEPTVTKTGYVLEGWYIDEALQTKWNFTDVVNNDMTLYAKWIPNHYTVNFDGNGGTGTMEAVNLQYDVSANLPTNTFIRDGYTFIGWSTQQDGNNQDALILDQAEVINLAEQGSVTLYAQWQVEKNSGGTAQNQDGNQNNNNDIKNNVATGDSMSAILISSIILVVSAVTAIFLFVIKKKKYYNK